MEEPPVSRATGMYTTNANILVLIIMQSGPGKKKDKRKKERKAAIDVTK